MNDCIFCKIINKEIPSQILLENEDFICFSDLNPKAKVHVLVVPKKHSENILELSTKEAGNLVPFLNEVKEKFSLEDGFKTIINTGVNGGQEINHLHLHILGGEKIGEIN